MKPPKHVSLKSQLVRYLVLAFLATCGVVVLGLSIHRQLSMNQSLNVEGAKMATTIAKQADQILPGVLITEEFASIQLQLDRMKESEGLGAAEYLTREAYAKLPVGTCRPYEGNARVQICTQPMTSEVKTIAEIGLPGEPLGYLIKAKAVQEPTEDKDMMRAIGILLGSIALAFLLLIALILVFIERHVRRPLLNLHQHLGPVLDGQSASLPGVFKISEVQSVARQVKDLVARYEDRKVKAAIGDLAAQVAHDIRSPLSVLSLITTANPDMPDTQRRLLESASARIKNIAEDLLNRYKVDSQPISIRELTRPTGEPTLVLTVLDRIIAEKRALYMDRNIRFHLEVSNRAARQFVPVDVMALARILSNLIDNSVEAIGNDHPEIWLEFREAKKTGGVVEITVEDNGRGIPDELLPKLGTKGASFNKANGTGLGIFYARSVIETAGGDLRIESEVGKGTKVTLRIPTVTAPEWFTDRLEVRGDQRIVIIDDDPTIHEFLKSKLLGFPLEHCIDDYLSTLTKSATDPFCYFLVDNKLSARGPSGLDLIQKFYISSRATLLTSDFESPEVQKRVLSLGLKMLPKPLLPYIEVQKMTDSVAQADYDIALLDDDELVGMAWKARAEGIGRKVGVFRTLRELMNANLPKQTPIYIDYHLGFGVTGVQAAIELRDRGYTNLHMATGSYEGDLDDLPHFILSVRGKDFPLEGGRST